jgi:hypothetical protein
MKRLKIFIALAVTLVATTVFAGTMTWEQRPGARVYSYADRTDSANADIFWVDSGGGGGDSTSYGYHPDIPFLTADYAVSQCTGNNDCVIYLMAGHVEDGLTANMLDVDVAGVKIIGLGTGADRPRFTYDDTDTTVAIGAASVLLENIVFEPSVSAVVAGIIIEAAGDSAVIKDCEFVVGEAAGTDEFITTIVIAGTAQDVTITGNRFETDPADTHCTEAIGIGVAGSACERTHITDNYFYGNWSTAAIIDGTTAATEIYIAGNNIKVKDGEPGIELATTTTGMITLNNIESSGVTCSAAIVAADGAWFENYCVTTDGAAAVPIGTSSVATIETKIDTIDTNVNSGNTTLGTINTNVNSGNTTLGTIDTNVNSGNTTLGTINTNVNSGNTTLGTIDTNVNSGNTTLGTINTNVNSGNTTLGTINTNVNSGNTTLALHGATIDDIEEQFPIYVECEVLQSTVVAAGINLTGVVTGGTVHLEQVLVQNGATAWDSAGEGAVFEMYSDNLDGNATFMSTTEASLVANVVMDLETAATTSVQIFVETGKLVKLKATTEDFTSDGLTTIVLKFQPFASGVTIAAGSGCQ